MCNTCMTNEDALIKKEQFNNEWFGNNKGE